MTAHSTSTQLVSVNQSHSCKAIVFPIAHYWFALPVSAVFKVMQCSSSLQESIQNHDLLLLDHDRPLTLLPLHHYLQLDYLTYQCLIIVHLENQTLGAIPTDRSPILKELLFSDIRPLPFSNDPSMRSHSPGSIANLASHVALVPQQDSTLKIFLLNLQYVLEQVRPYGDRHS